MRIPVFAVGVAVREGTSFAGRTILRLIGIGCEAIGARDDQSALLLGRASVKIGDMAYAFPWGTSQCCSISAQEESVPVYVVSFRPLAVDQEQIVAQSLIWTLQRLRDRGLGGQFLAMARGRGSKSENDIEVYDKYLRDDGLMLLDPLGSGLQFEQCLGTVVATIRCSRVVIATRLHAAIVSVAAGTPTVAIAYEYKVQKVFDDLGLCDYVQMLDDSREALLSRVEKAMGNPDEFLAARAILLKTGALGSDFVRNVSRSICRR